MQPQRASSLFQRLPLAMLMSLAFAGTSQAQSLVDMYEMAKGYDAGYQSAKAQYLANQAKADQGKSALLPTVGFNAETNRTEREVSFSPSGGNNAAIPNYYYTSQTAGLKATQPLYRPANMAAYQQSQKSLELADAALKQAEQDLIVRTTQAYFDVLVANQSLTFVKAQKSAVAEQLASAKRNFEVGTATITDTREAEARYDLISAQEIAADNDVRVKNVALELLVGKSNLTPNRVKTGISMPSNEHSIENWLTQSEQTHPALQQARTNLDIAKLETEKATAGHKPTLDLSLEYGQLKNLNATAFSPNPGFDQKITTGSAKVTLSVPIFAGLSTQNRIRETLALEDKARNDLEGAQRQVAQATRTAYLGLQSGLGQVKALEAAEASSQAALDANKLGYQVGVKVNIDVLNSQSQLYQTKRDLAKARYDVLLGQLKLRQASGTLKAEDLQSINALLQK
jgi:outer membrane protein